MLQNGWLAFRLPAGQKQLRLPRQAATTIPRTNCPLPVYILPGRIKRLQWRVGQSNARRDYARNRKLCHRHRLPGAAGDRRSSMHTAHQAFCQAGYRTHQEYVPGLQRQAFEHAERNQARTHGSRLIARNACRLPGLAAPTPSR